MKAKEKGEEEDKLYTEDDFSLPEEIIFRTKNRVNRDEIRERWIERENFKRSNLKKDSKNRK